MTPLATHLIQQIKRIGPMRVSDYMTQCLFHPDMGYYTTQNPIGGQADFITAPEISQMFGEMLGLCLAQNWLDQGAPTPCSLVELGPGTGQLMADILRATKSVPNFHAALSLHLVEVSQTLRARQGEQLAPFAPTWHDTITTLPDQPTFLIANEFLDCLPINQYIKTEDVWQERLISANDTGLHFVRADAGELAHQLPKDAPIGTILELSPAANAITADIATRIQTQSGCAIFLDYGHLGAYGDTLQSLQTHSKINPLHQPGLSDLTAQVDFTAIQNSARSIANTSKPTAQGILLERLGITARAQSLAQSLSGSALENHINAHRRLTHPDEMGTLFQTLAIVPNGAPLPPGFDV